MKLSDDEINKIIEDRIKKEVSKKITIERVIFHIQNDLRKMLKQHLEGYLKHLGEEKILEIIKDQIMWVIDERLTLKEFDDE